MSTFGHEAVLEDSEQSSPIEKARVSLAKNPRQMTMILARQLELSEAEVIRALPDERSTELSMDSWDTLMAEVEKLGEVHVIVSNGTTTIESVGSFGGFSSGGGFFNVQSGTLDMHIRHANIVSVYAVRKPSHFDGNETLSIQFFDVRGAAAFKVFLTFGGSAPSKEKEAQFAALIREFQAA